MKKLSSGVFGIICLFVATAVSADNVEIGVGVASVLQLQLEGHDNVNESLIGYVDDDLENASVLVGQANVVQIQTGGRMNLQSSHIAAHGKGK
ncbi:MAG: hypothetical protein BWK73_32440 [Thiothrix lacustris]|uniref:Porin domain-containing protein n=1 Tax=Thiothrix lacustris TaxID=525917 RepID=A0A1Y1QHK5_9GAMM|nr:MAG: hypothetical protein BWK73_32440 [Thiothrix lacustris]